MTLPTTGVYIFHFCLPQGGRGERNEKLENREKIMKGTGKKGEK